MTSTTLRVDPPARSAPETGAAAVVPARPPWVDLARRFAVGRWLPRLIMLLAVVPMAAMLGEVSRAGRLQHIDYLYQLTRITNPDGTLKPFVLENYLSNEHLLGLPSLVYWLNIKMFAGDNRTLGVYVVAVAALTVFALGTALPRTLPPLLRASLVVAISTLVFSLHGLWNFTRAMSGTAWLTANLIVVVALLLAVRGRWWAAWVLALLASVTYGTAFVVWPVLALLAVVKRESWWRRLLPLAVGGVIVLVWMSYQPAPPQAAAPSNDLGSLLYYFLAVVGKLWTVDNGGMAAAAGAVVLGVYAALAAGRAARDPRLWFWWALACHAFLCAAMVAVARVDYGTEVGLTTARYTSVSVPAIVLLAAVVHRGADQRVYQIAGLAVIVGLLGYALGAPYARSERAANKQHFVEAVAIRAGLSDAYRRYPLARELMPRLRALGHFPFTDDFTLGCGGPELGSVLDREAMTPLPAARGNKRPRGAAGAVEWTVPTDPAPTFFGKPVPVLHGWAFDITDPVRCVVVVDGAGKIVGGGVSDVIRTDVALRYAGVAPDSGFAVIGPVDETSRVVVIHDSGTMRWLAPRPPAVAADPRSRSGSGS
ncbi:MAG: hypothetical protein LC635_01570 [Pseudonocardiaceae bacterium]|nr:hypothetical protein [Pseudonocardiaceae bacterium]